MDKLSPLSVVKNFWYTAPVDVFAIVRALEIDIDFFNPRTANLAQLSGYIESISSGYSIGINAADHPVRQRFTVAHELGHYIYHRPLIGEGVDDNRVYRSTEGGIYHNVNIGRIQETQANQFAANLLMPSHLINELKHEGVLAPDALAEKLFVSKPAMRIRLGLSSTGYVLEPEELE